MDPGHPLDDLLLEKPSVEARLEADWRILRGEEPVEPGEIPRMPKPDLKKFILGVLDNSIFTSEHIEMRRTPWCAKCEARAFSEKMPCHKCGSTVGIRSEPVIEWSMVFLPIAFGVLGEWTKQQLGQIGIVWAYNKDALPRGVNGYPMFTTIGLLHIEDWVKASKVIRRESTRLHDLNIDE